MLYLIDGYNLLHALGMVSEQTGPAGLVHARRRLLDLLHAAHGSASASVTVVFDAHRLPRGVHAEQDYHGIQVRYAIRYPEADDLLEEVIRQSSAPQRLAVVSNDHRIQQAARRRGCLVMPCVDYMDWLINRQRAAQRTEATKAGKPTAVSAEELAHWRQTFADLDNDPGMRELFDLPWSDEEKP